jgi:hypothetical protein
MKINGVFVYENDLWETEEHQDHYIFKGGEENGFRLAMAHPDDLATIRLKDYNKEIAILQDKSRHLEMIIKTYPPR